METTDDRTNRQPQLGAVAPPYPPSWLDRFTAWLACLPLPWWLCYLSLWLVSSCSIVG